jgi:hypothetical protein
MKEIVLNNKKNGMGMLLLLGLLYLGAMALIPLGAWLGGVGTVLMVLGIIALLYQREFAVEAAALTISIAALALINGGADKAAWASLVKGCAALAIAALVLIGVCVLLVRKNGGVLGSGERQVRIFPEKTDYRLLLAALVLCLAAVVLALLVPGGAFYGLWVLAVAAFCLAVYYTIKLL